MNALARNRRRNLSVSIAGCRRIILALGIIAAAAGCHRTPPPAPKAAEITGPFTRLFDTGSASSATLGKTGLAVAENWTSLAEDDTTHSFAGDAVVVNDKLALAASPVGGGVSLFSRAGQALKWRARLAPVSEDGEMALAGLRISQNSLAAVALECAFKSGKGRTASVTFCLTTGANLVEVRAGEGTARLRIQQEIKYVIVPDYFADDAVVNAGSISGRPRLGLPAENCLVNLLGDGEAITACVWPYGQADADAIMEGAGEKASCRGVEIGCAPGKSLWVAILEGSDIWHSRQVTPAEAGAVELPWRRPFAAQWRCDFAGSGGLARSNTFAEAPGAGAEAARCWFDQDRAFARPGATVSAEAPADRPAGETTLLVYPIDRTPATPLTAFCVNDVMRSALGTGPCQYVLQAEGMGTEYPATPDLVCRWLEEEFRKGRLKTESAAVLERLNQMTSHVEEVQNRIGDYGKLADRIQSACAEPGLPAESRPMAQDVSALLEELRQAVREDENARRRAEQLTHEIIALAEQEGGAAGWQAEMEKVRALGGAQDRSLARCRMTLRRVTELCRGAQGSAADFADRVKKLAQSGLRKEAQVQQEKRNGPE